MRCLLCTSLVTVDRKHSAGASLTNRTISSVARINCRLFGIDSIRQNEQKNMLFLLLLLLHYCVTHVEDGSACRIFVDTVWLPWMCVFVRLAVCIHVHACLSAIWARTLSCQGSAQLIFMHSVTSSLQTLLNILFPWAFHCCLVSEINMYEARRWEFLIDLCGPALLFNICLGLLVPAQWR